MLDSFLFLLPFFLVALLYASVGHGGASGYLAVMALLAVEPVLFRPTALALNVVVSVLGTIAFLRAGYFRRELFWPLALFAVPFAYIGGGMTLPDELFRKILGVVLCIALLRLFLPERASATLSKPGFVVLVIAGAIMGLCAGLVGVGGGIFLTPLVILMGWSSAKAAAAISAPFILINSIAGLAGLQPGLEDFHPLLPILAVVVFLAGLMGARWGSRFASDRQIRYSLGGVLVFAAFKLFL